MEECRVFGFINRTGSIGRLANVLNDIHRYFLNLIPQIYYTAKFAQYTTDIKGFVNDLISTTNKGMINSKIPVRVESLGLEQVSSAWRTGKTLLDTVLNFYNVKGKNYQLLLYKKAWMTIEGVTNKDI